MKVYIDKFDGKEWAKFKDAEDWDATVKEVVDLNSQLGKDDYRAVCENGFLTHIYCSGFYTVPTNRGW